MDAPAPPPPGRADVETLAQALYEASAGGQSMSWAERGRIVRDAWLDEARRQLSAGARPPAGVAR